MLYSNDRGSIRDVFFNAWAKRVNNEPLETMEQVLLEVVDKHPEYHAIVANPEKNRDRDEFPEAGPTNPFFHMGMHLTIVEQVSTDRPVGVKSCFEALVKRSGDEHHAHHEIMEVLATWLGEGGALDEAVYIERLKIAAGRLF